MSPERTPAASARGVFVVLDGVDGCGKSTQAVALCAALRERGFDPLHVREPGTTRVGEALRGVLLSREHDLSPRVETLLFAAARAQTLNEVVEPALSAGRPVVCERFHPSTFAYQACAGGLDEREVLDLLERWAGAPAPDLEIVLVLPPEEAARRRPAAGDRIEDKGLDFQRRVARGYARYLELVPRACAVDGARAPADVTRDLVTRVLALAATRGGAPRA